jgi:hypothetical protein
LLWVVRQFEPQTLEAFGWAMAAARYWREVDGGQFAGGATVGLVDALVLELSGAGLGPWSGVGDENSGSGRCDPTMGTAGERPVATGSSCGVREALSGSGSHQPHPSVGAASGGSEGDVEVSEGPFGVFEEGGWPAEQVGPRPNAPKGRTDGAVSAPGESEQERRGVGLGAEGPPLLKNRTGLTVAQLRAELQAGSLSGAASVPSDEADRTACERSREPEPPGTGLGTAT